jgi:hypothetical protein
MTGRCRSLAHRYGLWFMLGLALGLVGSAPGKAIARHRSSSTTQPDGNSSPRAKSIESTPAYSSAGARAMISIPVSSKVSTAAWPRPGVPDYAFVVHSYGGRPLGVEVSEFDWTLQVESRSSLISLEYFRSDADLPGTPIGLFRGRIDDQALRDFHAVVTTSKLFGQLTSMAGHPGYTQSTYTLIEPSKDPRQQTINNSDELNQAVIGPVLAKTRAMLSGSFSHPERAVRLGLERTRLPEGEAFLVSIQNIGVDTISFTDPRWIMATGPLDRSVVMITEFAGQKPGEPARLDWKDHPLAPLASRPAQEVLVTLEPGATWQAPSAIWKRAPGKQYLAQFTWARYAGEPLVNGVYRIRGRADSPRLLIEP